MPRKMAQAVGTWNPGWMGHWDLQSQHQNGMLMHLLTLHRSLSFYMSGGKHVQDCAGIYISAGIQGMHHRAVESSWHFPANVCQT